MFGQGGGLGAAMATGAAFGVGSAVGRTAAHSMMGGGGHGGYGGGEEAMGGGGPGYAQEASYPPADQMQPQAQPQ